MNPDYTLGRGQGQEALRSACDNGFNVGIHSILLDAKNYRLAHLWLTGDEAARNKIRQFVHLRRSEAQAAACLIKDGLNRWGEVAGQPSALETQELSVSAKPLADASATGETGERDLVAVINEATGKMLKRLRELETQNAELKTQVRALGERERARRSWKIEDLAGEFPEVAALLQLFNGGQPQERPLSPGVLATAAATTAAPENLPTSCPIMGRPIAYTRAFGKHLRGITDARARGRIVKSLQLFAEHGPGHSGLNHKQLRYNALGVRASEGFVIRSGDKRILYRLTNEAIEFVAIVSRANKQIYSEE